LEAEAPFGFFGIWVLSFKQRFIFFNCVHLNLSLFEYLLNLCHHF
jgi:hypothetical protein